MELTAAVQALAALAQPSRLQVFRLLARCGSEGLPAGQIAARLGIPASTLSFHLRDLASAGLLRAARRGRSVGYAVAVPAWQELLHHLAVDCCQGRPALCPPLVRRTPASRRRVPGPPRVLFLCSQNSARSQLAEALLRHRGASRFAVASAGLLPGPVHPLARAALREAGIPCRELRSKDLAEVLDGPTFDHAVVVCPAAWQQRRDLPRLAADLRCWPVADPAAVRGPLARRRAAFAAARDELDQRIQAFLADFPASPPTPHPTSAR